MSIWYRDFNWRTLSAVWLMGVVVCLLTTGSRSAFAIGSETNKRQSDLNLTVDTRWAGCAHGGYYPIRIEVSNLGPERNVEFRFEPYSRGLPVVTRKIRLKPNAQLKFAISIPMTGVQSNGTLNVAIDGRTESGLRTPISLADVDTSPFDRPSLLVISSDTLAIERYEEAATWLASLAMSSSSGYYGSYGSARTEDHEIIESNLLPERWIDYSGLDLVAISLEEFGRISGDTREALLDWVKSGGNLLIFEVEELPQNSTKLNEFCELGQTAFASAPWIDANPIDRSQIPLVEGDLYSGYTTTSTKLEPHQWTEAATSFQTHPLMEGMIVAFPGNPFPGTRHEWSWLLKSLGENRYRWTYRNGFTSRVGHDEFLHFMIPGISGVPVIAFLILITIFSVVIGPLNYFYLNRHKRLYLLVITIPLIAFITSISLFSYSLIAHGFSTKSRIRSLMTVDQQATEALINSRVSLYSGLAPSGGLEFTGETAVFTIWPKEDQEGFDSGTVNWTNQQILESGWLKSRTRTQFYNTSVRDERGRLTISAPEGGRLELSNGFEYDLDQLIVRGSDGMLYYGKDIRAGGQATLNLAENEQLSALASKLREAQPALPDHISNSREYHSGYGYSNYEFHSQFSRSSTERKISRLSTSIDDEVGDGQYFGVFSENPDVPIGVSRTSERDSLFLLYGYY